MSLESMLGGTVTPPALFKVQTRLLLLRKKFSGLRDLEFRSQRRFPPLQRLLSPQPPQDQLSRQHQELARSQHLEHFEHLEHLEYVEHLDFLEYLEHLD